VSSDCGPQNQGKPRAARTSCAMLVECGTNELKDTAGDLSGAKRARPFWGASVSTAGRSPDLLASGAAADQTRQARWSLAGIWKTKLSVVGCRVD